MISFVSSGQLPSEGVEAAVGRGRGGDLAGAGPEAEDATRVGGLAAGQRVKGEGADKPQEQAQVGWAARLAAKADHCTAAPSISVR